ncbi:MAG: tetratricopeptide repeat protein, partial [Bryobacteraceae bacterium]
AGELATSGWKHFEAGELDQAERDLAEAAKLAPANAPIALALGQTYLSAGKPKLAIPQLEKAARGMGNPTDVRFTLAQAYQAVNDDTRALAILSADPPQGELGGAWLFSRGFSLFRAGRFDAAESVFRPLAARPGMEAPAQFFLGNCAYARGKYEAALGYFEKAIAAGDAPGNRAINAYYYNQGLALYELRRFEQAAQSFRQSIDRFPRDAMPYLLLGRCQGELGDYQAAMASYEKAIELAPTFRLAYYQLARLHLAHGDKQRGAELSQKVAELRGAELEKEEKMARSLKVGH